MENLKDIGLVELGPNNLIEIEGGNPLIPITGGAIMLSIYLFDNREKYIQGIKDSFNHIL